jgi:hypothetical protein
MLTSTPGSRNTKSLINHDDVTITLCLLQLQLKFLKCQSPHHPLKGLMDLPTTLSPCALTTDPFQEEWTFQESWKSYARQQLRQPFLHHKQYRLYRNRNPTRSLDLVQISPSIFASWKAWGKSFNLSWDFISPLPHRTAVSAGARLGSG